MNPDWYHAGLTPHQISILNCLAIWPCSTYDDIMARCHVARRTIGPAIRVLIEKEFLIRVSRGQYSVPKRQLRGTERDTEAPPLVSDGTLNGANGAPGGALSGTLTIGEEVEEVKASPRKKKIQSTEERAWYLETFNDLVDRFPNMTRCRALTAHHWKKIQSHSRDQGFSDRREFWAQVLTGIENSQFLRGDSPPAEGQKPFSLTMNGLLSDSKFKNGETRLTSALNAAERPAERDGRKSGIDLEYEALKKELGFE